MAKNRLRLDFTLQTAEERKQFLDEYLPTLKFEPNEHELNTLSDYLLWGKDAAGLNSQQNKDVIIKEWAPAQNAAESLEGLMEIPGFQETKLKSLGTTHYKTKRIVFDRTAALKNADPYFQKLYRDLFKEIDRTELLINYYELNIGKREKPPRDQLLDQFDEEEKQKLQDRAAAMNQKTYLKMRHYLVDLRAEQYAFHDASAQPIFPQGSSSAPEEAPQINADIEVFPIGLFDNSPYAQKIFMDNIDPTVFKKEDLEYVDQKLNRQPTQVCLDFRKEDHLAAIYKSLDTLQEAADQDPDQLYSSAAHIIRTLQYYEDHAKLSDTQKEILKLKTAGWSNMRIADQVNREYGKGYNDNYISTIYRHKILTAIAKAALLHEKVMDQIYFPKDFKTCKRCGKIFLRDAAFFMRQQKSSDGFAPYCKNCGKRK